MAGSCGSSSCVGFCGEEFEARAPPGAAPGGPLDRPILACPGPIDWVFISASLAFPRISGTLKEEECGPLLSVKLGCADSLSPGDEAFRRVPRARGSLSRGEEPAGSEGMALSN